jgi:hypothetical protein
MGEQRFGGFAHETQTAQLPKILGRKDRAPSVAVEMNSHSVVVNSEDHACDAVAAYLVCRTQLLKRLLVHMLKRR